MASNGGYSSASCEDFSGRFSRGMPNWHEAGPQPPPFNLGNTSSHTTTKPTIAKIGITYSMTASRSFSAA